jgi:flagellar hook-length control protein FliK
VEQNRELDQEKSRPAEQKSQSNQTDRTETASNREPKEAENSQKSGAGETASSAKKTESSKESSADKVSFASGETEAGEGTDSLSGEMAFDADISGENEEGEQPNMEMRKAALNGHAAQGGTAPQVPTQHAGGGPQAAGNVGRVEGASAAGKVSAIAETGKAGSTHGSNGSNSSPLHGQAAQPSGAAPAGAAPGTSAINGNAPSGKASEAASAERPLPSQVPEQILKSLHRAILNGDREIQIRLDPPELGSLRLNLSQDDDGLRIVIETSSEAARQALDAALPDLRRMLQEEDVHVQDFIVQAWNEEKPSDHEGWHGSYQGEYGDSGGGLSGEDEAMPGAQQAQGVSGIFNDHRVNMVA